jgi:4-hydroxy-tetrahydrodipicolinate synthase
VIETSGKLFGRVVTAMVTPFDQNLNLDLPAVERMVNHLISTGSSAIVVAGTTGESPTLDDAEKDVLLKAVVKTAAGRVKIIMGAGSNDTRKSIAASKKAEAAGADALLVVAPYYNKPNQDGLKAHFGAIASATPLPIMLYNIPGRTGININPETVLSLAGEYNNILALKDSTGNVEQTQEIAGHANAGFQIYSGDDNLTLPLLAVGASGVVSVASHLIGSEIKAMIESFFAGDLDKARSLHYKYLPLFKGLFLAPNPTCVKYALAKMGICREELRLPLVPLSATQRSVVDDLLVGVNPKKFQVAAGG